MKIIIIVLTLSLGLSIVTFSCKDNTKQTSETGIVDEKHDHYKCPMDCEEGKTYDEAGTCPVCKMDLKKEEG
jgi:hypothetical protein